MVRRGEESREKEAGVGKRKRTLQNPRSLCGGVDPLGSDRCFFLCSGGIELPIEGAFVWFREGSVFLGSDRLRIADASFSSFLTAIWCLFPADSWLVFWETVLIYGRFGEKVAVFVLRD